MSWLTVRSIVSSSASSTGPHASMNSTPAGVNCSSSLALIVASAALVTANDCSLMNFTSGALNERSSALTISRTNRLSSKNWPYQLRAVMYGMRSSSTPVNGSGPSSVWRMEGISAPAAHIAYINSTAARERVSWSLTAMPLVALNTVFVSILSFAI